MLANSPQVMGCGRTEWQRSDLFLSTSHVTEVIDDLYQGCQTYGPWAKPSPHEDQIRPHVREIRCRNYERPKLQFVLAVVDKIWSKIATL